jgi:hypothetical protein
MANCLVYYYLQVRLWSNHSRPIPRVTVPLKISGKNYDILYRCYAANAPVQRKCLNYQENRLKIV